MPTSAVTDIEIVLFLFYGVHLIREVIRTSDEDVSQKQNISCGVNVKCIPCVAVLTLSKINQFHRSTLTDAAGAQMNQYI